MCNIKQNRLQGWHYKPQARFSRERDFKYKRRHLRIYLKGEAPSLLFSTRGSITLRDPEPICCDWSTSGLRFFPLKSADVRGAETRDESLRTRGRLWNLLLARHLANSHDILFRQEILTQSKYAFVPKR